MNVRYLGYTKKLRKSKTKFKTYTEFITIYKALWYCVKNRREKDFRNITTHIGQLIFKKMPR